MFWLTEDWTVISQESNAVIENHSKSHSSPDGYCDFFNMRSKTAASAFFMSRILYRDDIINYLGNS